MSVNELLYFANPFCSWCWGFAPTLLSIRKHFPDLRISVATGRLGVCDRGPLSAKARNTIGEHWFHVNERSGQAFDHRVLDRANLVYDTKPSCRLLLAIRQAYPNLAVPFLTRLGERFFQEGADLTDEQTLLDIGRDFGLAPETALQALRSSDFAEVLKTEWQETEKLGITGYPTLLALGDGRAEVITIGFADSETAIKKIHALL